MIYDPATERLLELLVHELEAYGKWDARGVNDKAKKAKERVNKLAQRLLDTGIPMPGYVRTIE